MHSTQGVILRIDDFRESDERVVLYTREFGKIAVIAKGVKRIEAKLRGNLDIFNFADVTFVEGSRFLILTGVDSKERFEHLVKNAAVYRAASAVVRLVDEIFEENLREEEPFGFLVSALRKFDEWGATAQDNENLELFSWLLLKKFQVVIFKNQGYAYFQSLIPSVRLSSSACGFFEMLKGGDNSSARLTKQDFIDIEDIFTRSFGYIFNMRPPSWVPKI